VNADAIDRSLLTSLTLARGSTDRAAELRADDHGWAQALAHPDSRAIVLHGHRVAVAAGADGPAEASLLQVPIAEVTWPHTAVLLGRAGAGVVIGALTDAEFELSDEFEWSDLRELGARLSANEAGYLTAAVALTQWHASHRHCPKCGAATEITTAGWVRACPTHGEQHPRTDPAVIVLVLDSDDRALLGRRADWQPGWFSTLAGFVEAGEAAEHAVVREVFEESGVAVDPHSLVYLGSQPWPFPRSLMLGYHARALSTDVNPDGVEISEVRWFTRAQMAAECAAGTVRIPPRVSVARHLIERWYGAELPGEWSRP
jgi:NAD+ diphosphatase